MRAQHPAHSSSATCGLWRGGSRGRGAHLCDKHCAAPEQVRTRLHSRNVQEALVRAHVPRHHAALELLNLALQASSPRGERPISIARGARRGARRGAHAPRTSPAARASRRIRHIHKSHGGAHTGMHITIRAHTCSLFSMSVRCAAGSFGSSFGIVKGAYRARNASAVHVTFPTSVTSGTFSCDSYSRLYLFPAYGFAYGEWAVHMGNA